jgi:glucoamylase
MEKDIEQRDETKPAHPRPAPGRPGERPTWETGAKVAVGTSVTTQSRLWFTISNGHLNEIYFPDLDRANTRFVRLVVSGKNNFFSDDASDANHLVEAAGDGIPAYRIESRSQHGRYSLIKEIVTDPDRDTLLMRVRFCAAQDDDDDMRLFVFSNPHMGDLGKNNDAWAGQYKGLPMLFAHRNGLSCAIAASAGFTAMTCGYMGTNDGLGDLRSHGRLTTTYNIAEKGNVTLLGEIGWRRGDGNVLLALAFGGTPAEAGQQARAGLLSNFDEIRNQYVSGWREFQSSIHDFSAASDVHLFRTSAAVCRIHESKRFRGAFVASLSIPWGFARSDKEIGGYHVTWPRDMCETALALLACGDPESARRALFYLECTQDADGHWPQNMWLDGTQNWGSRQMDETAVTVLLADALLRAGELGDRNPWQLVKKAAGYLVRNGPVAQEDRWEALSGYATFTMAVEIAALLAAADFAERNNVLAIANFLRETADAWNEAVDELTYAQGTDLAHQYGVDGYYVRLTPPSAVSGAPLDTLTIKLKNHPKKKQQHRAVDVVSPDALALVRFGLRAPDDPRILNTVKMIDAILKVATATGPVWRRYTDDGYGEHEDGSPYRKTGIGRGWPLLAGERAHYELDRGDFDAAEELRRTIARQTSECGLIPEQIWDAPDIPACGLFNGRPTGSGMPLVWAHAEYIQLVRSLRDGRVWSKPPQTFARYVKQRTSSTFQIWTVDQQRAQIRSGKNLRIDLSASAVITWSVDNWNKCAEIATVDSGLGVHYAQLDVSDAPRGTQVRFQISGDDLRDKAFVVSVM